VPDRNRGVCDRTPLGSDPHAGRPVINVARTQSPLAIDVASKLSSAIGVGASVARIVEDTHRSGRPDSNPNWRKLPVAGQIFQMKRQLLVAQLLVVFEKSTAQHRSDGKPCRPVPVTPVGADRTSPDSKDRDGRPATATSPPTHDRSRARRKSPGRARTKSAFSGMIPILAVYGWALV